MSRRSIAASLLLAATPAFAQMPEARVAPNLRPPEGERLAFVLQAKGVQIYACQARTDDPYSYAWSFVAPDATLSQDGNVMGRHFAGPTWASVTDPSSVKGAVRESRMVARATSHGCCSRHRRCAAG